MPGEGVVTVEKTLMAKLLWWRRSRIAREREYRRARLVERAQARDDARAMLLDGRRGGHFYMLDELGSLIWDRLEHGATVSAIADSIVAEYDVARDVAEADARAFLEALAARRLVVAS